MKNRANIAASILQNPEILKSVYESSQDSDGSALKENEKYLDSIEGKIQQFTNEIQELWTQIIDSDFVKELISLGTTLVDIFGKFIGLLNDANMLFPSIVGFVASIFSNKFADGKNFGRLKLA